tara:strand:- start:2297 stop:2926 length:630 start_codon:yes stop_codon:yes gene_type:complete
MAIGDTDVVISNKALTFLAADPITSFSDGTASADACQSIYKIVKESTIGLYPWSFSLGKQTLARETTTPTSEWSYQFALPNDMLSGVPRAVRASTTAGSPLIKNWEIGQSSVGGTVLFSDELTVTIDYQKTVDEGSMPTYFVTLLAYQLAWHLAQIITDQISQVETWKAIALGTPAEGMRGGYFRQAVNIDSAGQTSNVISDYMLTELR